MKEEDKKVNLFVLGAAKCGTTSLYHYLNQHPSILMAEPKEPFFFEAEYELGNDFYMEKYFAEWAGQSILGEARHRNLYLPFVVPRIKAYAPDDAKFLVILRNPVDRAFSHWWHSYSWGDEKKGFEDSIETNLKRLETGPFFESNQDAELYKDTLVFKSGHSPYPSYIDSGFYAEQIERYIDAFGADRVKIMFLDDLKVDVRDEMKKVFHFIGLPDNIELNCSVQNESLSIAGKKIIKAVKLIPARKLVPAKLRSNIYHSIRKKFRSKGQSEAFTPELRQKLIDIYEPHNIRLEEMTGRDLSHWRKGGIT